MCVAAVAKTLLERVAADNSAGVKATPGTFRNGGASFATTHWSIVAQSALTNVPEAENALGNCARRIGRQSTASSAGAVTLLLMRSI